MTQDNIFLKGEGDAWFKRNKDTLMKTNGTDLIPELLTDLKITPTRILDAGCASGYYLESLREKFNCEGYGVDPSIDAIETGMSKFPRLSLSRSTIAEMTSPELFFDMVMVRFVLHWIDRNTLLQSCAKVDSCLQWGGHLVISDFFTEGFLKRKYHHTEEPMFTYKQFYPSIFLRTGNYRHVATRFAHYDETDRKFITILQKENMAVEQ